MEAMVHGTMSGSAMSRMSAVSMGRGTVVSTVGNSSRDTASMDRGMVLIVVMTGVMSSARVLRVLSVYYRLSVT
jgi:hypothetical protein